VAFRLTLPLSKVRRLLPSENCKVLIVDDDPAFRRALRTSLAASGFDVSEARNGEESLIVLRDKPGDIVLLDINMPGMGGIEHAARSGAFRRALAS